MSCNVETRIMRTILACSDLDDALSLAFACSQFNIPIIVPLPNGRAWCYVRGEREPAEWPAGIDQRDLYCVVIE